MSEYIKICWSYKPHCDCSSLMCLFMVALSFKNLWHCVCHSSSTLRPATLGEEFISCCINAVVCQIQAGVILHECLPRPHGRFKKKTLKPSEVGGEPSVGEHLQLPAAPLRNHLSTRSAGADLTGASAFIFFNTEPYFLTATKR